MEDVSEFVELIKQDSVSYFKVQDKTQVLIQEDQIMLHSDKKSKKHSLSCHIMTPMLQSFQQNKVFFLSKSFC